MILPFPSTSTDVNHFHILFHESGISYRTTLELMNASEAWVLTYPEEMVQAGGNRLQYYSCVHVQGVHQVGVRRGVRTTGRDRAAIQSLTGDWPGRNSHSRTWLEFKMGAPTAKREASAFIVQSGIVRDYHTPTQKMIRGNRAGPSGSFHWYSFLPRALPFVLSSLR